MISLVEVILLAGSWEAEDEQGQLCQAIQSSWAVGR